MESADTNPELRNPDLAMERSVNNHRWCLKLVLCQQEHAGVSLTTFRTEELIEPSGGHSRRYSGKPIKTGRALSGALDNGKVTKTSEDSFYQPSRSSGRITRGDWRLNVLIPPGKLPQCESQVTQA
ncbi:hypothetical protein G7K_4231-t1 [Saitoella complicata NRRL Y-17804]|uniref:Uncharacterized protein n=1 Tax=Saitoella complicata (strain BCRC 22490 / CBS 7301 / JCM 7358 / NBRC 10748 / NRRL Y-17804) TaxID=698492 RepID=A0A0E9NK83_SAICN|nr:hypothetical protein G7K_4231-t1 [Saitoella complicata NRRL Y-17804]